MCFLPIFGNSCVGVNEPFYNIASDYRKIPSNVLPLFLLLFRPNKLKKVSETPTHTGCSYYQCELDHRGSNVLTSQQFASYRLLQSAVERLVAVARQNVR